MLVTRFLEPRSIYACRIHDGLRRAEEAGPPAISAARYPELPRALALGGAAPRAMGDQRLELGFGERPRGPQAAETLDAP